MTRNPPRRVRLAAILIVLAVLAGCASPDRLSPDKDGGIGGTGAMAE